MALSSHRFLKLTGALLVVLTIVVVLTDARRPSRPPRRPAAVYENYDAPSYSPDQHVAASGHGHHGRVQIKVYRGPDHHHHAPHGYWVKQPADDAPHHH